MKKILIMAGCLLVFGCNKTPEKEKNTAAEVETDMEIPPPIEGVEDSSRELLPDTLQPAKTAPEPK